MNYDFLIDMLKRHEGFRAFPYKDSVNILTIGYGRNLEQCGISQKEAEYLLRNDVERAILDVCDLVGKETYDFLGSTRQAVLVNMCFNLGKPRLAKFKNMFAAIRAHNYELAAAEMLNSKWAEQVGMRAEELANYMDKGDTL